MSDIYTRYKRIKVKFNTHKFEKIVRDILMLDFNKDFLLDVEFVGASKPLSSTDFEGRSIYGAISVMTARKCNKSTILIDMDSAGCRLFENIMNAHNKDWNDFICACIKSKGKFKKIYSEIIVCKSDDREEY